MSWTKPPDHSLLRKFGMGAGILFSLISFYLYYKKLPIYQLISLGIGTIFFILGFLVPSALKYIYIGWMGFAHGLSYVNTRIILFIVYVLTVFPTGIIMKLIGKKLLVMKPDKSMDSYWEVRNTEMNPKKYERHF